MQWLPQKGKISADRMALEGRGKQEAYHFPPMESASLKQSEWKKQTHMHFSQQPLD